jgi:hypothetical protein
MPQAFQPQEKRSNVARPAAYLVELLLNPFLLQIPPQVDRELGSKGQSRNQMRGHQ